MEEKTEVIIPYPGQSEQSGLLHAVTSGSAFHHGRFIMALREQAKKEQKLVLVFFKK